MEEIMKILHSIQGELQTQKKDMKDMENNIKNSINKNIDESFKRMETRTSMLEQKLEVQQKKINSLDKQMRKKNLVFFGVNENEKRYDDLVNTILEIIVTKMGMSCQRWEVEMVVRIGKKADKKIRPVVVTISTMSKKLEILRNKKSLNNTNIYVKEDFPLEVLEKRRDLQEKLKEEREAGNKVALHYDKIVKFGSQPSTSQRYEKMNTNKRLLSESPEIVESTGTSQSLEGKPKQIHKKTKPQNITNFLRPSQLNTPNKSTHSANYDEDRNGKN